MTSGRDRLLPEQRARVQIQGMRAAAGWAVQDHKAVNRRRNGFAVREGVANVGPPGYVPFVNGRAVGLIEAKPQL